MADSKADTRPIQSGGRARLGAAPGSTDLGHTLRAAVRSWPEWIGPLLVALWVAVWTALIVMSVSAHSSTTFPIDPRLSAWVQQARGTPLERLLNVGGDLDGPVGAVAAYIVILAAFLFLRLFRETLCLLVSGLGAEVISQILNVLVARPRPPHYHGVVPLGGHSFPSGHVADALGLYGFLIYLCVVAGRAQPKWRGWLTAVQIVCAYFILVVGPSRVLEGQHWPSDVAAGYLAGAISLTAAIVLYHVLGRRDAARKSQLWAPAD